MNFESKQREQLIFVEDAAKDGYLLREHARLMPPGTNGVSIGLRFSGVATLEFRVNNLN